MAARALRGRRRSHTAVWPRYRGQIGDCVSSSSTAWVSRLPVRVRERVQLFTPLFKSCRARRFDEWCTLPPPMPPKLKKSASSGKVSRKKGKPDGRGPRVKRDSDSALGSLVVLDQDGAEVSDRASTARTLRNAQPLHTRCAHHGTATTHTARARHSMSAHRRASSGRRNASRRASVRKAASRTGTSGRCCLTPVRSPSSPPHAAASYSSTSTGTTLPPTRRPSTCASCSRRASRRSPSGTASRAPPPRSSGSCAAAR